MPPVKRCAERCALSHRVIDAITAVCRIKNEYYLAKEKQPERVDALALGLKEATRRKVPLSALWRNTPSNTAAGKSRERRRRARPDSGPTPCQRARVKSHQSRASGWRRGRPR